MELGNGIKRCLHQKDSSMVRKNPAHCTTCEETPPILSLNGASAYIGVSPKTLRRRIAEGAIPAYRLEGSRGLRIKRSDLDAAMRPIPSAVMADD